MESVRKGETSWEGQEKIMNPTWGKRKDSPVQFAADIISSIAERYEDLDESDLARVMRRANECLCSIQIPR